MALWQGKGQGEQPGKGQDWGAQGWLGVIPLWSGCLLETPLNNSSGCKLGQHSQSLVYVISPALAVPLCYGGPAGHPSGVRVFPPARDVLGPLESHICCLLKIKCQGCVLTWAPQNWLSLPTPMNCSSNITNLMVSVEVVCIPSLLVGDVSGTLMDPSMPSSAGVCLCQQG